MSQFFPLFSVEKQNLLCRVSPITTIASYTGSQKGITLGSHITYTIFHDYDTIWRIMQLQLGLCDQ